MDREKMIEEISLRVGMPEEEVADVLEEQDMIFLEEEKKCKRKKCICMFCGLFVFIAGVVAGLCFLDKHDKINMDELENMVKDNVKKYVGMARAKIDEFR